MAKRNSFALLTAALAVTFLSACGGGGGGGGGGTGTSWTLSYSEPTNGAAGNVVLKLAADSTDSQPSFDVVVYGPVTDAYNIAFRLFYDSSILRYRSVTEGTVMNADGCNGGTCTELVVDPGSVLNYLLVGLTRLEAGNGMGLPAGENVVMTLRFDTVGAGTFVFDFPLASRALEDPTEPPNELSTGWYAGQVTVTSS